LFNRERERKLKCCAKGAFCFAQEKKKKRGLWRRWEKEREKEVVRRHFDRRRKGKRCVLLVTKEGERGIRDELLLDFKKKKGFRTELSHVRKIHRRRRRRST